MGDVNGVVYTYQPSAGLHLRDSDADVLDLELPWDKLRRRSPEIDFERPLGRPGIDPRVDDTPKVDEEEQILTHWLPPTRPQRYRCRAARRVEAANPVAGAAEATLEAGHDATT